MESAADTMGALVHLTGPHRGATKWFSGSRVRIGTAPEAEIRFPLPTASPVAPLHATLERRGRTFRLTTDHAVWVNGEPQSDFVLAPGDVLEIGPGGPMLRFRLYDDRRSAYKSLREAFCDCVDCARLEGGSRLGRAGRFLLSMPREIVTQTGPAVRRGLLGTVVFLALSTMVLGIRSFRLERQLTSEALKVQGLSELLARAEQKRVSEEDLLAAQGAMDERLERTMARVEALEARAVASREVVAATTDSVALLQGGYGFDEVASGRPLRFLVGSDGEPLEGETGEPLLGLEGDGPPVEVLFTGTGWVATTDGLIVTNRHVAVPWDGESTARTMVEHGFRPVFRRFLAYFPGHSRAFEVETVGVSDRADVAALRCLGVAGHVEPLPLGSEPPHQGEEVILLGYPTGIRALLARSDNAFLGELLQSGELDFWQVTRRLAAAGRIAPLASRGIVGQVTDTAIVYDAATTRGGSGGPVVSMEGRVVAVNTAVLPEFSGSNLGVPAARVRELLQALADASRAPPETGTPPRVSVPPSDG